MSNNLASADPSSLPYYVATYKGRSVAIKRDTKYETTIKLVQKSIPKLRTADIQDIFISTTLSDYGGALVQLSEEIWPDVVSHVKTVEITLEGDDDTASEPINMRPGSVTWTARPENAGTATATTNQNVQDLPTPIASRQPFSDPANTSTDPQHSVSITIRTPSHTLLDLDDLPASTKIGDVKSLIEHKHGMPATLQRLNLLGNPLDDSATLAQSDITFPTIADLTIIARQCMIYLHPGTNQHNQFLSYQNVGVKFSLNRAWELAALHRSAEILSKDYTQSVSWTVDVATDGVLTEHGSGTKLSYLFWDGV
ncbi:hypothetical protein FRC10_005447 [Ceratobasidium sp. 414]|nr:hypothetical protein FRC10_005447 [Ceratobasidium sp. 414]